MNDLFNEQYGLLLQDLQEISNPYERAHIRALLLGTLAGLTEESSSDVTITGKDAIKNDIAKPIQFEEEAPEEQEQPVNNNTEVAEEELQPQSNEPRELDLDHDPAISDNNDTTPMIVETEDGDLDITEAYNLIANFSGTEEEKIELATNIALYNLTAIYEGLSQLKDCHNKMMLSYYLSEYGLEAINEFISELTDATFNDVYEFVNDENLDGLIISLESAAEEE